MYAWRKEGEHSVLARINPADIRGIFGKNIVINPGEAGFRRKNGISEDIINQGILKVMSFPDLIMNNFQKDRIQAYMIDVTPFDVDMHIMDQTLKTGALSNVGGDAAEKSLVEQYIVGGTLLSKDQKTVGVSLRINVSVNTDKIDMFLNILKGRNSISSAHIWARLDQLIHQKILSPLIEEETYENLKGVGTRRIIEENANPKLKFALEGYGLLLHNMSLRWHISKDEFIKNLPVDLDKLMYQKVSFEDEKFDFTYGEFFIWLGVILIIFIAALLGIFFLS